MGQTKRRRGNISRKKDMYQLLKQEGRARLGSFVTPHGTVQLPAFMNVGTAAAIKGGVSSLDLKELHCQVELCNTYHLHLRPGDEVVCAMGGLHRFMGWEGPILTDSGGFQVFSLSSLRKITEEGVHFQSHIDGRRIFMGPEESMQVQSNLASTIAMAFDECIENPAERGYVQRSVERTARWLVRCRRELDRLNALEDTLNPRQLLFGINQGSTYADIRIEHMKRIRETECAGYAIGGLAVGETAGMGTFSPGRESATSTMKNTRPTRCRSTPAAAAQPAAAFRAPICATCCARRRCSACACS